MRKDFFILLFFLSFSSLSQETITVKYFGLTIHPFGDPSAHLQPYKLDKNARFVLNSGLFIGYEKFLYQDMFSVKYIQGFLKDCSNGMTVVSHIGIRGTLIKLPKHHLYFGVGPTLVVRDSWKRFGNDYTSSGYFNETKSEKLGDLQWKIVPYGFEFEYDYVLNNKNQISFSVTPVVPLASLFSIGWKHWFHYKEFEQQKVFIPKKRTK